MLSPISIKWHQQTQGTRGERWNDEQRATRTKTQKHTTNGVRIQHAMERQSDTRHETGQLIVVNVGKFYGNRKQH